MTREHKVALMVGFALVLVVGILVADHFSKASQARVNGDIASGRVQDYAQFTPEPALPSPIPSGPLPSAHPHHLADPLASMGSDDAHQAAPAQPSVFEFVMGGPRPQLSGDVLDTFSSAGSSIRNGIAQLGLDQPTPALRLDRSITPQPQAQPARDPIAGGTRPETPAVREPALPVSRGRLQRHEVARGDNLTKIADRYYQDGRLWRQLQSYNAGSVGADGQIRVGATLLIPPKDVLLGQARLPDGASVSSSEPARQAPSATPARPEPAKQPAPVTPAQRTYTVQPGDTLLTISQRQLGTVRRWTEIRDLNKNRIDDVDSIQVGLVLALPSN